MLLILLINVSLLKGKLMDKKVDMLSHGPKSLHPLNAHSPNQQQSSTVNSTNNNLSVSNNNRKSSETVTSSPEDQVEEQPNKAQAEPSEDDQETKAKNARDLAAALDEDTEDSADNQPLATEPQASLAAETCSVIANVDSKNNKEEVTPEKKLEAEQEGTKSDDDSLAVKKVRKQ